MNTFLRNNVLRSLILLFIGFSVIVAIGWKISPPFMNYAEEKISQETLEHICADSNIYQTKLNKIIPDLEKYDINPSLKLKSDIPHIYEVFRWTCEYEFTSNEAGGVRHPSQEIGLSLDDYCRTKNRILKKSTYHHYNDPNSWYCVNPNF
ncbi:MAG: hypothetical protein DSM106950_03795 [Stigonema ocellatum SAG 48.90 = DSM 106950]|nr:hypothetical protein [Stigonema ocellatum SAG 48.90 = DSM 106950]